MWTIETNLALTRPIVAKGQRISRVILSDSLGLTAHEAQLLAIAMSCTIHKAEMPVGSNIIDWSE